MFSVVFERQGEGSREVNGLPHVCPRPLARNQHRVHATTCHALEYLTLAPFIRTDIRLTEANQVRAFFAVCGTRSDALAFMTSIARRAS